jgi:hypothetical protein
MGSNSRRCVTFLPGFALLRAVAPMNGSNHLLW